MKIAHILSAAIATLAAGNAAAQTTAQRACVTQAEAEAVMLFVAPDLIRQTGQRCAATLPATALIRRASSPLIAKFEAESDRAWPLAKAGIGKIAGPEASQLLESDFARPMVGTLVAPLVAGNIATSDCSTIERAANLLQPLPARNVASLAILFAQADAQRNPGKSGLPLCPVPNRG